MITDFSINFYTIFLCFYIIYKQIDIETYKVITLKKIK